MAAVTVEERGGEPVRVADTRLFEEMLALMPRSLQAAYERGLPPVPQEFIETADAVRERRAAAKAKRLQGWEAVVPVDHRGARLTDLDPTTQHQAALREWLGSGNQTLVLHSTIVGNGKTRAAYALGYEAVAADRRVVAYTMADLNEALKPGRRKPPPPEVVWEHVTECDLLIVDDLGGEHDTEWTSHNLLRLLDCRVRSARRTIITTNRNIATTYDARVADRVKHKAWFVEFKGRSRRAAARVI